LKRLARQSAFSIKAKENNIIVVADFDFDAPKTKNFTSVLTGMDLNNKKSLFVLADSNNNVYLSSRNLQGVKAVKVSELNTYSILNTSKLIISESCVDGLVANLTN
ncbi:MAG TPA: 50S ribosomal protein L4, partial [Flavobacteriaceae bacterium]|nr:50S ribosomal protein L4 [Flavobacteriaceae bacterium]